MEVSGELHNPATLTSRNNPYIHFIAGSVDSKAGNR
jgi:hypothetical protein